jgi:hypothetical protein
MMNTALRLHSTNITVTNILFVFLSSNFLRYLYKIKVTTPPPIEVSRNKNSAYCNFMSFMMNYYMNEAAPMNSI